MMTPEGPSFKNQRKEGCRETGASCNEDPLFRRCIVLGGHRKDCQQGMVRKTNKLIVEGSVMMIKCEFRVATRRPDTLCL